jgi:hypothetical protein
MVAASHPEALIAARKSRSREGARPIRCLDDVPVTNLTGQLGRPIERRQIYIVIGRILFDISHLSFFGAEDLKWQMRNVK